MFCSVVFNRWIWVWRWRRGLRLQAILTHTLVCGKSGFTPEHVESVGRSATQNDVLFTLCLFNRSTVRWRWGQMGAVGKRGQITQREWEGPRSASYSRDCSAWAVRESVDRLSSVCGCTFPSYSFMLDFTRYDLFFVLTPSCDSVSEYFKILCYETL